MNMNTQDGFRVCHEFKEVHLGHMLHADRGPLILPREVGLGQVPIYHVNEKRKVKQL